MSNENSNINKMILKFKDEYRDYEKNDEIELILFIYWQ
jgi:hypothetical protein